MNGLERRLRGVAGVADLTIELGDGGLDGIRVRIDEGSDEAEVLENIRRILVAYGLRSRKHSAEPSAGLPVLGEQPKVGSAEPWARVRPTADGLAVEIANSTHSVLEAGERSPIGAAEAMVRAVARFRGMHRPERLAIALDDLDGVRVITMLGRRGPAVAVSAAVCEPSLTEGLFAAADALVADLESAHG
ncbi:MAG TPA: hypothetical protein VIY70_04005 [Acidimicrobiia bacterium]